MSTSRRNCQADSDCDGCLSRVRIAVLVPNHSAPLKGFVCREHTLAVCSTRNAHRRAAGSNCERQYRSRSALSEERPGLCLQNTDEINALDELFVLGPFRVGEFAFVCFLPQLVDTGLRCRIRPEFGNPLGNL